MKANYSKTYLLPLLEDVPFEPKYVSSILNTYIENPEYVFPTISVLHKFNYKDSAFPEYEQKLVSNEYYIKSIDQGENVIYVFKFPEKYLKEYHLFKKSIYSEFTIEAKQQILAFWTKMYKSRPAVISLLIKVKNVLYRSDILRKQLEQDLKVRINPFQELGEFIDLEKELLTV